VQVVRQAGVVQVGGGGGWELGEQSSGRQVQAGESAVAVVLRKVPCRHRQ